MNELDGRQTTDPEGYTGAGVASKLSEVQAMRNDIAMAHDAGEGRHALGARLVKLAEAEATEDALAEGEAFKAMIGRVKNGERLSDTDREMLAGMAAGGDLNIKDEWEGNPEGRVFLFPRWLPAGEIALLTGTGGGGKSTIALQLALAMVLRRFGYPLRFSPVDLGGIFPAANEAAAGPVVIVSWEDGHAEIQRRINRVLSGRNLLAHRAQLKGNLYVIDMAGKGEIWGPGDEERGHISTRGNMKARGEAILAHATFAKARLLVIDPLAAAYMGDENSRSLVRAFTSRLGSWARENDCAVLVVAHPPKSGGVSGSTDWHASARSVWLFEQATYKHEIGKKTEERPKFDLQGRPIMELSHHKSSYALPERKKIWVKWQMGGFYETDEDDQDDADGTLTGEYEDDLDDF